MCPTSLECAAFDLQSGLGPCFRNQAHNGGVITQRLASPVLADLAKESVLDRIPLGGPGGIVTDSHPQLVGINQFFLEGVFPEPTPGSVAPATIGQDEQLRGLPVASAPLAAPPVNDGIYCELRGVMRGADQNRAPIGL